MTQKTEVEVLTKLLDSYRTGFDIFILSDKGLKTKECLICVS